jgi:hypothetical protein
MQIAVGAQPPPDSSAWLLSPLRESNVDLRRPVRVWTPDVPVPGAALWWIGAGWREPGSVPPILVRARIAIVPVANRIALIDTADRTARIAADRTAIVPEDE